MSPPVQVKDGGTWKVASALHVKDGGVWKKAKEGWVKDAGTWKQFLASNTVPAGLIVPLLSGSAPAGWSNFTAANGKDIVGAGSSYAAATSGGTDNATFSLTSTTSAGAHTGPSFSRWNVSVYGGTYHYYQSSAGNHSHTLSGGTDAQRTPYKEYKLIKANADQAALPANAILFGASTLAGLTNVETSVNRIFGANTSTGGTGGSSTATLAKTTSSNGGHMHGTGDDKAIEGASKEKTVSNIDSTSASNHTHTITASLSIAKKAKYLSAWTNAAAEFGAALNGIGMWEGGTAPEGWVLCNGANGTPDLRNYFIKIGTTANHGNVASASNSATGGAQAVNTNSWTHNNRGSSAYSANVTLQTSFAYHQDYSASHAHNTTVSGSYDPAYYALTFIMRAVAP